jgi:hypothetical protein
MSRIPGARRRVADDFLQFWRDWKALEHADVSPAGIAYWDHADSRSNDTQDETNDLPEHGRNAPSSNLQREHQPVRDRMCAHRGLADDVSALKVLKSASKIASVHEFSATGNFTVECPAPLNIHDIPSMRPNVRAERAARGAASAPQARKSSARLRRAR